MAKSSGKGGKGKKGGKKGGKGGGGSKSSGSAAVAKLKALDKQLKGAKPRKGGAPLDDGEYDFRINDVKIGVSQNGKLRAAFYLEVVNDEDYTGRKHTKYNMLESAENIEWHLGDLDTLGLPSDASTGEELAKATAKAKGLAVSGSIRTQGEYTNTYFNELVEETEGVKSSDDADDSSEDAEIAAGSKVTFEHKGKTISGVVKSVDGEEENARVKRDDTGKVRTVDLDDLTVVAAEDSSEDDDDDDDDEDNEKDADGGKEFCADWGEYDKKDDGCKKCEKRKECKAASK